MKYIVWVMMFVLTLSIITQASEERGLQMVTIQDQAGQEVGLYKESHALVIGVSDYTEGWPDLPGVKKDIEAVRTALEQQGFHVVTVENPTRPQLEEAFHTFITKYGQNPDNRLIFYFAGHGHTLKLAYGGEMGYIVPVDAVNPHEDQNGFLAVAMDMQQIEVYAKRIQAKHALFLFDSCFSGSIFAISRAVPENISYKTAQPVRQFMTSGSAEETVPDESVFRQQFIAALQGEADLNRDGYITGSELGEFLQGNVVNYSKGAQHPQYGKIRDPNLDKGDFVFILPGAVYIEKVQVGPDTPPQAGDPEFEMWELIKDSDNIADIRDFLTAFPQGRFTKVAQLKLKQLERTQAEPPEETPQLSFELLVDFEQGLTGFDEYQEEQGGVLKIIDDPTGSKRGKILKGIITKKIRKDEEEYQIYPEKNLSFRQCPCRIQQDIWMSKQLYKDVRKKEEWHGFLSVFDNADWDSDEAHRSLSVALWDDGYLHLGLEGEDEDEDYPDILADAPLFLPETWHAVTVEIDAAGMVFLYQDDQLVTQGKLRPPSKNGIAYFHGGPISAPSSLRKGGYVLVDNFRLTCW